MVNSGLKCSVGTLAGGLSWCTLAPCDRGPDATEDSLSDCEITEIFRLHEKEEREGPHPCHGCQRISVTSVSLPTSSGHPSEASATLIYPPDLFPSSCQSHSFQRIYVTAFASPSSTWSSDHLRIYKMSTVGVTLTLPVFWRKQRFYEENSRIKTM